MLALKFRECYLVEQGEPRVVSKLRSLVPQGFALV